MPASSSRRVGQWEVQEVVGSGSFAIVWKARHASTGQPAAVKEILADRLNKKLQESLESEIATLQRLHHANIVGLLDLVKEPGRIYLVLEYCGGGDLAHHLRARGPLSEASCRYLLRQLAEGLKVLRQHQIIHRDLKPQNLLLSDSGPSPTLKIADFGFARSLQPAGMAETLCGSPLYMAPEVLQLHRYDARADLWSVGTILFELLTGKPPFNGANHLQLIQNIERGDAVLPDHIARSLSPGCRLLLSQLLRRNPTERISFDDFFAHPFLQAPVPAGGPAPWQQLPIAAASLPTGSAATVGAAAAEVAAAVVPGGGANAAVVRPPIHGSDAADPDPMLLPRVVGVMLEQARARCSSVLDAEEEARQLSAVQAAAAALGGGAASGMLVGGAAESEAAATAAAALAEEAAAAVGALLAACRVLAAALAPHGGSSGSCGGGSGSSQELRPAEGNGGEGAGRHVQGNGGGAPPDAAVCAGAVPSPAALSALSAHARSALCALDEHLNGAMARLLLTGDDADSALMAPPTPSAGTTRHASAASMSALPGPARGPAPPAAPLVPACCDALLGAAVHAARTAAGEEMLGHTADAAAHYSRAADVLTFMLTAPPPSIGSCQGCAPEAGGCRCQEEGQEGADGSLWDAVLPPLAPNDRQRLTRYHAAVRLRQSAVAAAAGPAPAPPASTAPFLYPHRYGHPPELGTQPYPYGQQDSLRAESARAGVPYSYSPHGAGGVVY
ncbi:hypothetical protein GPECTOR_5g439 [Gonium pectorale]|uniref:Protein kinase domain-containing protein n=1 Tax=Gonium pectorale TaxID=33097 RepID=A0A150GXE5_GONPE|nr:hypothetical protein GPECTOR_5g439 [Gonium pectorale]|eukprot:KXZ54358.1 hypothetical protein GPECTOR_5g439 [Gonium pectorale]